MPASAEQVADTMRIALAGLLCKAGADPHVLRDGLHVLAEAGMEMEVEVEQHVGAARHEQTAARTRYRNGSRERHWDTGVGSLALRVPRVRDGSYFPAMLEPRTRVERALVATVQEASVQG